MDNTQDAPELIDGYTKEQWRKALENLSQKDIARYFMVAPFGVKRIATENEDGTTTYTVVPKRIGDVA